jgi:hypothetical protein
MYPQQIQTKSIFHKVELPSQVSVCEISGRPVDRVYVNSHQSMQKHIDKDRLSMKKQFSLNVFIVYVYVQFCHRPKVYQTPNFNFSH